MVYHARCKGVNYFYWGSMRKESMARAIRNIIGSSKRDELVIVIQSYSRSAILMELFLKQALKKLKIDRADIFTLFAAFRFDRRKYDPFRKTHNKAKCKSKWPKHRRASRNFVY